MQSVGCASTSSTLHAPISPTPVPDCKDTAVAPLWAFQYRINPGAQSWHYYWDSRTPPSNAMT